MKTVLILHFQYVAINVPNKIHGINFDKGFDPKSSFKVSKKANIRNLYNQTLHLTQDTTGESVKRSHTREPRGQPFPSR